MDEKKARAQFNYLFQTYQINVRAWETAQHTSGFPTISEETKAARKDAC